MFSLFYWLWPLSLTSLPRCYMICISFVCVYKCLELLKLDQGRIRGSGWGEECVLCSGGEDLGSTPCLFTLVSIEFGWVYPCCKEEAPPPLPNTSRPWTPCTVFSLQWEMQFHKDGGLQCVSLWAMFESSAVSKALGTGAYHMAQQVNSLAAKSEKFEFNPL